MAYSSPFLKRFYKIINEGNPISNRISLVSKLEEDIWRLWDNKISSLEWCSSEEYLVICKVLDLIWYEKHLISLFLFSEAKDGFVIISL